MNSFISEIENAIKKTFEEYSTLISQKYSIDLKELENVWNDVCKNTKINLSKTSNDKVENKEEKNIKKAEKKIDKDEKTSSGTTCPYVYSKGQNTGEVCGSKPKSGCEYCSKHSKFEGLGQQEKKKMPKAKSISSETVKKSKSPSKKPLEKVIRLNKDIDRWWNTETQLVFKTRDERIVVASYRDEKINELTDDDILLCEQYGFKYENLKDTEDEDEEDDDIIDEKPVLKKEDIIDEKPVLKKEEDDDIIDEKPVIKKKKEVPIKQKEQPKKLYKVETKKPEEKKIDIKNLVEPEEKKIDIKNLVETEKKTIKSEINKNNIKAKDIESVLNELQFSNDFDDDDELVEEEEYFDEDD